MPDDLTVGELSRRLDGIERRMEQAFKDSDDRHSKLAREMVPTDLWKAEHVALGDDVKELRDELRAAIRDAAARIDRTSLERMAVLTEKIDALGRRISAHEKTHAAGNAWSRSKTLTVAGIIVTALATVLGAWIAAILTAKGVH